jgi:NADPH-dependent 2,4-dienoyl-CoA reductase/sulfur reductase-like enzyme
MSRRVLVVGACLGGLRAAEAVRSAGYADDLVVVGEEPHPPYNRPPLTKEALAGTAGGTPIDVSALVFRRRASVDDVRWLLGPDRAAVSADLARGLVRLADGSELTFDGLVIATGLRSRRLALPAADGGEAPTAGRHAVRTVEDAAALARDLHAAAAGGRPVVVIGAGFIGCEVAATARGLGCEVHVVAPERVAMERPLGHAVGATLQRRHEAHGVTFHLGRLPVALEGTGRVSGVVLDDGTRLPAGAVVEALGCVPNTEWLAGTGLDLSDGVLTDGWLRAVGQDGEVRPNVVAVGDIARFPNALVDDVPRRVEHWSVPTDTAKRAGPTLVAELGGAAPPPGPVALVPSFWSDQYGYRLQSFGTLGVADAIEVLEGDLDGDFVAGYRRDGVLTGVAGIGMTPNLVRYRGVLSTPR